MSLPTCCIYLLDSTFYLAVVEPDEQLLTIAPTSAMPLPTATARTMACTWSLRRQAAADPLLPVLVVPPMHAGTGRTMGCTWSRTPMSSC